jgi:cell division septation protein DedD
VEEEARAARRAERRDDDIDVYSKRSLKLLDSSLPHTILIGSFRTLDEARALAQRIQAIPELSAAPWILEVNLKQKGKRYRVLVGKLESKSAASVVAKQLKGVTPNTMIRSWTRWK